MVSLATQPQLMFHDRKHFYMLAVISLGFVALILCLILTPLCRNFFLKNGFVDHPDGDRKQHTTAVPRIGGIPIVLSYAGALLLVLCFAPQGASLWIRHRDLLWSLLPAAGIIFLTGVFDDLVGLKPWQKLAGQFAGATWAVLMGARITALDGPHPGTAWIMWIVSVLWLVGCSNAFNLIDGLDGLASGVGLFATLTVLLAAILQGNWGLAAATVPLAGCLLGFLRYNFNPASVFLGDSGSLTIGFLLGCFGVIWSQKSATLLGMVAPMMAFALPLLEVGLSIGRRILRREPIFKADRGHIHHRLLNLGFEPRAAALILYGACGVAAILSLAESSLSNHVGGIIIVLFCFLSAIGVRYLRYIEFSSFAKVLQRGLFSLVREEIHLASFRNSLREAKNTTESWVAVRTICKEMGFTSVELTLDGETFFEVYEKESMDTSWHLRIGLQGSDELLLTRASQIHLPSVMGSFIHIVQEGLRHEVFAKIISGAGRDGNILGSGNTLSAPELPEFDQVPAGMSAAAGDGRS